MIEQKKKNLNLYCENLTAEAAEIPSAGTRVPAAQHKKISFTLLPDTRSFHQILCRMCITEDGKWC